MKRWAAVLTAAAIWMMPSAAPAQERFELRDGEWRQEASYPPDSPEGRIQTIRKTLAQGHAERAIKLANAWIKEHPGHPLLVEAHLLRGDAKVAHGRFHAALYDYEAVIRNAPASPQYHTALEREFEIGRAFANGKNRRFLGMPIMPAEGDGEELLIRTQERAPGSDLGERASLELSDYYFRKGQMDLAAEAYDLFLENYPNSDHREWAMLRLIQASLARFKGPRFDPTGLIEAAQRLRMYREEFPASADRIGAEALLVRIDESLALKEWVTAQWYETREELISAAYLYQRLIEDYPQTASAQRAIERLEALDVPGME